MPLPACHLQLSRIRGRDLRHLYEAGRAPGDNGSVRSDYQDLVDEISELLGAPATLENRDFELIAFGSHEGGGDLDTTALDPVRTRSILTRRSTAQVRAWFEAYGIARATGPVHIPASPEAGVLRGRICLPVRHRGIVRGYVWLLDTDPRPSSGQLDAAMAVTARIGTLMADEASAGEDVTREFRAVLTAAPGWQHDQAHAALRAALGSEADRLHAVVCVGPWPFDEPPGVGRLPGAAALCVLPAPPGSEAAFGPPAAPGAGPGDAPDSPAPAPAVLAALVRLRTPGALGPAETAAERLRALSGAAAAACGHPAHRHGPDGPRLARGPRRRTRRPRRAPAGPRRPLVGPRPVPPADRPVGTDRRRPRHRPAADGGAPGTGAHRRDLPRPRGPGRTAAALGVHRQTLYYRLSRVEQLTGLDLDDGEDRLLLHMALKAARL